MNQQEISNLAAQGYTHIPVVREVAADLDTPLSAYLKLANEPFSYLFESVQGGERWGRYSIIGLRCDEYISINGNEISIFQANRCVEQLQHEDPLQWLDEYGQRFKVPSMENLPRYIGGLVGYFGYDTIRYIEPKLGSCDKPDELNAADIMLMMSSELLVFDALKGSIYIVILVAADQQDSFDYAQQRLDSLQAEIQKQMPLPALRLNQTAADDLDFTSGFSESGFKQAVVKAKEYITAGDIMQVVLSQRLSAEFSGNALDMYWHLRRLNPSPYMYYLHMGKFEIVGSSPEILVRQENNEVTVRPIAGTRPRGENDAQDALRWSRNYLADPKELAEHLMLIDLGRNDVGRIAQTRFGSVD